jgi:hypothetical protein
MEQHRTTYVKVNVRPHTRRLANDIAQLEERPIHSVIDRALLLYLRQRAVASYDVSDPSRLTPEELAGLTDRSV